MISTEIEWDQKTVAAWDAFVAQERLSDSQADQCRRYTEALLEWNQKSNLTRIVNIPDMVAYHFQDSMRVNTCANFKEGQMICDVGSGAGFPGIPLAIKRPDLKIVLLEVNQKKVAFLRHIIDFLPLTNVTVIDCDWRTLLRQAPVPIDWFLVRASLQIDELLRVFKSGCLYCDATLIYWASDQWRMEEAERPFFLKKEAYTVGLARRWYVFFGRKDKESNKSICERIG